MSRRLSHRLRGFGKYYPSVPLYKAAGGVPLDVENVMGVLPAPAYLDEMAFRFKNRQNPYLFRDAILKLLSAKAVPFRQLVRQI